MTDTGRNKNGNGKRESMSKVCGARLRGKKQTCKKLPCKGRTRCRLHGGATPIGPSHPSYINGKTSKYPREKILEHIKKHKQDEANTRNLREELATVRGLLSSYLDHHHDLIDDEKINAILRMTNQIEKIVSSLKIIEEGHTFTIKNVQHVLIQVIRIIKQRVKDPSIRNRIAHDFKELAYTSVN